MKLKYWWIFIIRGGLALVFGCIALVLWPILELGLMGFFGVYIFMQGALNLIAYLKIKKGNRSLPIFVEGILGIAVGIFLVMQTNLTPNIFLVSFCS